MPDALEEQYRTLRSTLERFIPLSGLPPHLIWRISALIGGGTVTYVDSDIETTSPRVASGRVFLLTEDRVVFATITDAPVNPNPRDSATFTVHLMTWARTSLQRLELIPDKEGWRNSDGGWSHLNMKDGRPEDLSVTLHYRSQQPITLPMAPPHSSSTRLLALWGALPMLLDDVAHR
jgi:hypothetical protein